MLGKGAGLHARVLMCAVSDFERGVRSFSSLLLATVALYGTHPPFAVAFLRLCVGFLLCDRISQLTASATIAEPVYCKYVWYPINQYIESIYHAIDQPRRGNRQMRTHSSSHRDSASSTASSHPNEAPFQVVLRRVVTPPGPL